MNARRSILGLAAAALVLPLGEAWAADEFPNRELTLVVNFGPGGVTDLASRELAREMSAQLQKPIVIANRPGALGTLGPAYVAKRKPDGYELAVVSASATTIAPRLMDVQLELKDLKFAAGFGINRYGIVVRSDSPYKTIADLVAAGKTGKSIFFGSPSTPNTILMLELGRLSKSQFELVAYKSGPETAAALLGGQVEVIAANPAEVLAHIQSGKLRLIGSGSSKRWPEYPDVPTLREAGYPIGYDAWMGVAAPAGTPDKVVDTLQASIEKALQSDKLQDTFKRIGVEARFMGGAAYTRHLVDEAAQMKQLIEISKIQPIK